MSYKWKPSKSEAQEFAKKMDEIDDFCRENGIHASLNNDSYYFMIGGQNYRVSNHTFERSEKMTDQQRYSCLKEAAKYSERATFVSDMTRAAIWDEAPGEPIPESRVEELEELFDLFKLSIKDIRQQTGLSQAAFATRFFIPKRTIENWESGARIPPDYVRLLLAAATKEN